MLITVESRGDYQVDIERRLTGAPRFRVRVTLDRTSVGEDYSATIEQAEELAKRMIQRHQELRRQTRGF
jgi:translation initiation factor 2 alpha subunit (eIF-2alpha)